MVQLRRHVLSYLKEELVSAVEMLSVAHIIDQIVLGVKLLPELLLANGG